MNAATAFVVALVGAESTGKTTLAWAIGRDFAARGHATVVVAEYLREFCDARARTPTEAEQASIAAEQARRIDAAAAGSAAIVVADTTALQVAVYSDLVFGDTTLYADAIAAQRRCDLTLLTANDLPWHADGLQRDGPHVREPVAARLRHALDASAIAYRLVEGSGAARLAAAVAAIDEAMTCRRAGP